MSMRTQTTIDREAERRAKLAGIPAEAVRPYVEQEVDAHPIRIDYEILPHNSLCEIIEIDGAQWMKLNIKHKFVSRMMLHRSVTPEQRSKMEVVLAAIYGLGGTDPEGADPRMWAREQAQWSDRLEVAIGILTDVDPKTGESMLGVMDPDDEWLEDEEDDGE